jgi:tRNA(Leu) C34 or U34 (ribose-2'-O)-methylase TrmL
MPTAEFAHNQKTHSTTQQSPFFLMMGYEPQAIPTAFPKTNIPSVEQRILNLQKAREEAIAAHDLARQKMAEGTTRGFTPFRKGSKVWLEGTNL